MPVLLFALWLAFSERITVDVIIVGVIAVALVSLFMYKFSGWSTKKDAQMVAHIPAAIAYVFRLIFEVCKANVHMIALVLSDDPNGNIQPRIVAHKTNVKTQGKRVALANSITLTPGTVTVDVMGDVVFVHAIDEHSQKGLSDNPLEKMLENMERNQ